MRLETIPILAGLLLAVPGLALIADAFIKDGTFFPERRSRPRPERHKLGEAAFGVGLLFVSAALIGGDRWRFTTLSVVIALLFCTAGVALNHKYVRGMMFGPALGPTSHRRATDEPAAPEKPAEPKEEQGKLRIR
ncbi:MAG TPA: hypothetical protein VJ672_16665 [Gemmatimonadaceae bacterium]|nr:hypothetical protein [Gemmatimonadaceae bacterium]